MHDLLYDVLLGLLIVTAMLPMIRLIQGPTLADRAVAFDALAITTAGILALLSVRLNTDAYVESILILALLGFLGTLSIARFIERGQLILLGTNDDAIVADDAEGDPSLNQSSEPSAAGKDPRA